MSGGVKHLLARHRDLDGSTDHTSGDRSERRVHIIGQFAAEAAADVAGDDADVLRGDLQRSGDAFTRTGGQLRGRM